MAASAEARTVAPGGGWRLVARKELSDHLLSARFTVLLLILGLAVVGSVYSAASGIREVAPEAAGQPSLFLRLFTVSPSERIPAFFTLVGFLAPLLGIAFGFDAVNSERAQGTLPRLLSQPIHRDDVINGKFAAGLAVIALMLTSLTLMVSGIGLVRLGVVPSLEEVVRISVWLAVAVVYVGFWLAFAILLSVVVERAATAALATIAAWLVLALFVGLLVGIVADALAPVGMGTNEELLRNAQLQLTLRRLSPATLFGEATLVLLTPEVRSLGMLYGLTFEGAERAVRSSLALDQSLLVVWPHVVGLTALTVICFAAAYVTFMRQEVRA